MSKKFSTKRKDKINNKYKERHRSFNISACEFDRLYTVELGKS